MQKNVFYCKDCCKMDEVDDESIDLIISGPPYWDFLDYKAYAAGKEDYRWDSKPSTFDDYLDKLRQWYTECFRVLKKGRFCFVNLGNVSKNGRTYALPFYALPILEKIGYEFRFEFIWHKLSGGKIRAQIAIQHPYPGYFIPNERTEYILGFQKSSKTKFSSDKEKWRSEENLLTIDSLFKKEIANNVWHILPSCYPLHGNHPCPFPPEIPQRLIQYFSLKGETVLDPFMGIGSTARVAKSLARNYIGYELEPNFIEIAEKTIDDPIKFRSPTMAEYGPLKEAPKNKRGKYAPKKSELKERQKTRRKRQ